MVWTRAANLNDTVTLQSGQAAVGANAISVTVVVSQTSTGYKIGVAPNWNTDWWITGKTAGQFIVNFSTPAPADGSGSIDWTVSQ